MDDLISRQAAIEYFMTNTNWHDEEGYEIDDSDDKRALLKSYFAGIPSAQPKQKVGKWIIKDNPGTGWYRVTCSECGEDVTSEIRLIGFIPNCKALWDYCPYCGAKMEEQDDRQRKSHC